jgi:ABC-type Fe3+/spermidine/putrescine transport system ATPase subunit
MRDEIRAVQKHLGITALYVTHDQEEALVISDRIAVISAGRIQQVGTPREIYTDPANLFVATFVGKVNLLDAELGADLGNGMRELRCASWRFKVPAPTSYAGTAVKAAFRPEDALEVSVAATTNLVSGTLAGSSFLGPVASLELASGGVTFHIERHRPKGADIAQDAGTIFFSVPPESFMLFDPTTGQRLTTTGARS